MCQNEIHPQLFAVCVIQQRPLALLVRLPLDALVVGVQVAVVWVLHQACDRQKGAVKMRRIKTLEMSAAASLSA